MLLNITEIAAQSLHEQIANQLIRRIIDDELPAGSPLLSIRRLARQQHVGRKTVEKAYRDLLARGLIRSDSQLGYCVAELDAGQKRALHLMSRQPGPDLLQAIAQFRMDEEMEQARRLQAGLMPPASARIGRLALAAFWQPCKILGGDLYDYFSVNDHTLAFVIADACGHGLAAALLIAQMQAILKNDLINGLSLRETMLNLNRHLRRFTSAKTFVSMICGLIDSASGQFEMINAGHHPAIITGGPARPEHSGHGGPALGVLEDADFAGSGGILSEGQTLVLYTDGIVESRDSTNSEYGQVRLEQALFAGNQSAGEMLAAVRNDLMLFSADAVPQDDCTLFIIQYGRDDL